MTEHEKSMSDHTRRMTEHRLGARQPSLLLVAGLLCACARSPAPGQLPAVATTALVDVTVLPLDRERVLPAQTVLVQGERIVAIGPASSLRAPAGARVIDGRGKYLMPGLADMHTHLVRREDLLLYLALGVTTVRNMWGAPLHVEWRDRIARGRMLGPTIYTAGPIIDGPSPVHDGSLVLRAADEVDRTIELHRAARYDFLKVYTGLERPVYARLISAAAAAGLPVAGHIPRAVGLDGVLAAGQRTVEHLNVLYDALQADDSPVKGKLDRASRARRLDFIDESKIPPLVRRVRAAGTWVCPTRVVMDQDEPASRVRARLRRPEMKVVPDVDLMIWTPRGDPPPAELARGQRGLALGDKLIRSLRDGGARLLLGTDLGNPLVVAGFSVHDELAHLVRAGLTPFEALSAGTRSAAELLGGDFGTVAVGKRADLLLLEGNPLADVSHARRIAGVMVRGRWLGAVERAALLAEAEAAARGRSDLFARLPALLPVAQDRVELRATYEVTWKGVRVGVERMLVERSATGELLVHAQSVDVHKGQSSTLRLHAGAGGCGTRLVLESDGAYGRGHVKLERGAGRARLRGQLLPGPSTNVDLGLDDAVLLDVDEFLAGKCLLRPRLLGLAVGKTVEVQASALALGSTVELPVRAWTVTRAADLERGQARTRRYELASGRRPPLVLLIDDQGWPLEVEIPLYGAKVRIRRVGR